MDGYHRTRDVATTLGVSMGRVRQIREQLRQQGIEVGRLIGRDLWFSDDDVRLMRQRRTAAGRPKQKRPQGEPQDR